MDAHQQQAFNYWMGNSTAVRLSLYNKFHTESNSLLTAYKCTEEAITNYDEYYQEHGAADGQQPSSVTKLTLV